MKNTHVYKMLIIFVIFIVFKKFISIVVQHKFPTYKDLKNASPFWKFLVKIRDFNNVIALIATFYFLYNFTLNYYIRVIFYIIFFHVILYFLIDERLIYLFINDDNIYLKDFVHFANIYIDTSETAIIAVFAIYSLVVIFGNTN